MSKFKFIDGDLPEPVRTTRKSALIAEFTEVLRSNPGKWAEYPLAMNPSTVRVIASNIRRADPRCPKPFLAGGFDARVHEGVLYVRFIGDEVSA